MEKSVYINERIKQKVVKRLRKYEREQKLNPSISATIEHLLTKYEKESNLR